MGKDGTPMSADSDLPSRAFWPRPDHPAQWVDHHWQGPVRLESWTLHAVRLPYTRTIQWADVVEDSALYLLLELRTREGKIGVAEATLKPTWSGVSLRSITASLEEIFLPRLQALDLADGVPIQTMLASIPENQTAKMLIDNAWWDLRTQAAGLPMWKFWGGTSKVDVSCTLTRASPEVMAAEARDLVERYGFRTLKVKGGQSVRPDLEVIAAVRRAVGSDVSLYLDANGVYAANDGVGFARMLGEAGINLVEDPYPIEPNAFFRDAQAKLPVVLLVDFACASARDATTFLDLGAKALSAKPGRYGLTEAWTIARRASAKNASTVVGLFGESMLGALPQLAFAASLTDRSMPAETSFLGLREQILREPLSIVGGQVSLPEQPGLANLIDWDRVRHFKP
jgi:L-Ala-D/L-Glu epimerase